jgi:hypothetical protein
MLKIMRPLGPRSWALLLTGTVFGAFLLVAMLTSWGRPKGSLAVDFFEAPQQSQQCVPLAGDASLPSMPRAANPLLLPQKLVYTARLRLEVKDYTVFDRALKVLAAKYGYLSNLQRSSEEHGRQQASLALRVEASRFEAAMGEFRALGTVKQETVNAEDVTRTFVDLEARRANKRATAARLRGIIATRAGKLSEVVEAEEALGRVTEELESMEAQARSLDQQIAFATLNAEVFEPLPAPVIPSFWRPFREALLSSRALMMSALMGLLQTLAFLLPWALVFGIPFGLWFRRRRRRMAKDPVMDTI